jgi:hypothetical protein
MLNGTTVQSLIILVHGVRPVPGLHGGEILVAGIRIEIADKGVAGANPASKVSASFSALCRRSSSPILGRTLRWDRWT